MSNEMKCPMCSDDCDRDEVHNGIAMLYGPWGCRCGWSERDEYNHAGRTAPIRNGYRMDSRGGATPICAKNSP